MAFQEAGYEIRKTEISPHHPPVAVLRLIRRTAARFSDDDQFSERIRQILDSVGISLGKADLISEQTGDGVLVSFPWQPPVAGSVEGMQLDQLLAMLP